MMIRKTVFLVVVIFNFNNICCFCEQKYVTFCNCLSDLGNYKSANWSDVIIDSTQQKCASSIITSKDFERLEEIKLLFVVNYTRDIENGSFRTIGQTLEVLRFYDNDLPNIRNGMFSGFRKLNRFLMTDNNVETIEGFSFEMSTIKTLDLSNNRIESIPEDAFRGGKIKRIFLKNNKLSYINENAFDDNLEILKLDHNNLEYLEKGFITKLVNLKELSLSHNKLSHISDIKILENVEKLFLSFNNINFINSADLENLKELVYLDLSNNRLERFSLTMLKKVKSERMTLCLSYNLLTNLKIQDNAKPMTLTFFGNPWNCKCLVEMEEIMIRYNFTTSECNSELLQGGLHPICIEQGECKNNPTENKGDLRRFMAAVNATKENLPCDLFREIKPKDVVTITPP